MRVNGERLTWLLGLSGPASSRRTRPGGGVSEECEELC